MDNLPQLKSDEVCPTCLSRGFSNKLKVISLSFDENITMCIDPECDYINSTAFLPCDTTADLPRADYNVKEELVYPVLSPAVDSGTRVSSPFLCSSSLSGAGSDDQSTCNTALSQGVRDDWLFHDSSVSGVPSSSAISSITVDSGVETADSSETASVNSNDKIDRLELAKLHLSTHKFSGLKLLSLEASTSQCCVPARKRKRDEVESDSGLCASVSRASRRQSVRPRRIRFGKFEVVRDPEPCVPAKTAVTANAVDVASLNRRHTSPNSGHKWPRSSFQHLLFSFEQCMAARRDGKRRAAGNEERSDADQQTSSTSAQLRRDTTILPSARARQRNLAECDGELRQTRSYKPPCSRPTAVKIADPAFSSSVQNTTSTCTASSSTSSSGNATDVRLPTSNQNPVSGVCTAVYSSNKISPSLSRILDTDSLFVRSRDVERMKVWARTHSRIRVPLYPVTRRK